MIQRLFKVGALLFLMFQQNITAFAFPTAVGSSTTTASMTTIATKTTYTTTSTTTAKRAAKINAATATDAIKSPQDYLWLLLGKALLGRLLKVRQRL